MPFAPDEVERLTPGARVEVQDWIARRYLERHTPLARERRRALMHRPIERRGSRDIDSSAFRQRFAR